MSKKRKIISLAVLGVLLLASLALSLLLGKGGAKESLQTIMRDAVLHEDNKISLFGLMDVNPAVVSGFIVTGVLLVLAALIVALPVGPFLQKRLHIGDRAMEAARGISLLAGFGLALTFIVMGGYNPFIYFNF